MQVVAQLFLVQSRGTVLSVLIDKPGGITVEDTQDLIKHQSPECNYLFFDPVPDRSCWKFLVQGRVPKNQRKLSMPVSIINESCTSYIG